MSDARPAALLASVLVACGGYGAQPDALAPPDAAQPYFRSPVIYPAGSKTSAVAIGDVNGDGTPDLVVAGNHGNGAVSVLLGFGGGTFEDPIVFAIGMIPSAIVAADFDGDSRADVAITDAGGEAVYVALAGSGGVLGSWTRYSSGPWPVSIIAADVNADGHVDLVTANNLGGQSNGVSVLLGDGSGAFAVQPGVVAGSFPMAVVAADFDHDGKLDLAVADQGPVQGDSMAALLLGGGNGTFAAPAMFEVGNFPEAIAVGDLNGDGLLDLAIENEFSRATSVLIATGAGTYAPQQHDPGVGPGVAIVDLDADGKPELLVAGGELAVLHGTGDGAFDKTSIVPCACGHIAIGDLDGDGKPDLAGVFIEPNGATWDSPTDTVSVLLHAP